VPAHVPVIGVGNIAHPDQALRVLDDGVELVALGRALLLDADWAVKVREMRVEQIRSKLTSEEDRQQLDIPGPMREYTKRSIQVSE
jgi:2,4-dienoyl-CoA reductase-like NADH-dependent reductase (Old Yellow Enzyme family)